MFFFFNDTATTEIYTLSLHDALPIYVVGLDVAMDNPLPVRVGEGVGDLPEQTHGFGDGELPLARQPGAQRFPLHERHGVVQHPAGTAGGQERHDVGVLEPGGDPHLALETIDAQGGCELGRENLEDYPAAQGDLVREKDTAHPPAAQLPLDAVGACQVGLELPQQIGQKVTPPSTSSSAAR